MIRAEASQFVRDGNQNELSGNEAEPEHGRERNKSRETQHFMKHGRLTLRVISHTCQYGLGDSVDHSGDEGRVPYCSSCWPG